MRLFFAQLFASGRKQIAFMADEKSLMRISHRLFATSRSEAEELGLLDKVKELGWKGLSAKESGKIGGMIVARKKKSEKNMRKYN